MAYKRRAKIRDWVEIKSPVREDVQSVLLPLGLTHAERTLEFRDTADMLLWASWFFRYHKDVTVRKIDIQYNIVNHRLYLTALRPGNWVMDGTEEFTPNVRV